MPQIFTHLLGTLEYVFAIVTLLGGVIAVHEFGHFIFAKWAGIRVDTFSIGFGPKLFSKKWHETEYCLSLVPLGGFVKIYGQDPEELVNDPSPTPERAFVKKSLPRKLSVLFGGPLFNYFLAILIFTIMAMVGWEKFPATATRVVVQSPAHQAGLRSGDKILEVDGKAISSFDQLMQIVSAYPDKTVPFRVERSGKEISLRLPVQKEKAITPYGEPTEAGYLVGVSPVARAPVVVTSRTQNSFGLQDGDTILSIQGAPVRYWEDVENYLEKNWAKLGNGTIEFTVSRGGKEIPVKSGSLAALRRSGSERWNAEQVLEAAGIFSQELVVKEVMADQPAHKAGVKPGDRLASVDGKKVYSFEGLRALIQTSGENGAKAVSLVVERDGKLQTLRSELNETKTKDPLGQMVITYTVGIRPVGMPMKPANMLLERTLNPFKATWLGSKETWNQTVATVVGLKKLVAGEVSLKTVGGPIMIGKIAGDTLSDRGWRDFLRIMAIISISLGVFNLLPIPILDGGHVVFAIVESIRGRPISQQATQMALKVGMSLLIVLMIFAVFNDLTKVLPF